MKKNKGNLFDTSQIVNDLIKYKLRQARNFRENYNPTLKELDTFIRGEQWTSTVSNSKEWHGKPVTNFSHLVLRRKTSELTFDDLHISLRPQSSANIEKVTLLELVVNQVWKQSNAHYTVNETVKSSRLFPYGITKIEHIVNKVVGVDDGNLTQGEIVFKNVSPSNFFWDPKAFSIEEADYCFESTRVSSSFLKRQKGFDQKLVRELLESKQSDTKTGSEEAGEIYDQTRDYQIGQKDDVFILDEVYVKYPINESTNKVMKLFIVNDKVLWQINDIGIDMLPYSELVEFKQPHEFAGKSSVMLTLDNQKYINQVDAVVHNLATQYQNPQKVVSVESGISPQDVAQYGDAPGAVFQADGDIDKAIRNVKPNEIDPQLIAITQAKKNDIFLVAGIAGASGDKAGTVGATATGMNAFLTQANAQDSDPIIQFRNYAKRLVTVLVSYLKTHGEEIEYRIDHPANSEMEYTFEKLNPSDYKEIGHDIIIDVPLSEFAKQQKKNELFQLLSLQTQTGVQYVTPEMVIDILDMPNKIELINNIHTDRDAEFRRREMETAQLTAQLFAQAIADPNATEGVSIQEMAQAAAMQAVQMVEEAEAKRKPSGTGGGGVGVSAPQNQG